MGLSIPGKVIETFESDGMRSGKVSFNGVVKHVCLEYTPEAGPGDYVLVHVGFALGLIDAKEADRTYRQLEDLGQLERLSA
jgi:hydrogenase expression/formation protein HypC